MVGGASADGDGVPLHPEQAKNAPYHQSFSTDSVSPFAHNRPYATTDDCASCVAVADGKTWTLVLPMATVDGVAMGCSRPRMLLLAPTGPLLLVGGRNVVGGRGEPILWVRRNGCVQIGEEPRVLVHKH